MALTLTTDFTGEYKVQKDSKLDLQKYITKYEKIYLVQLLGAELYDLFIADLDNATPEKPQTAIFKSIYDPFQTDDDGFVRVSEGMRVMMKQFIYFHFVRDSNHKKTEAGVVINKVEVSESTPYNGYNLVEAFNEGVTNAWSIQFFIDDNIKDYPKENMQLIEHTSGI